ncbi:MAG TPA: LuxR C-terminal-related transcriptional regulator [Gaiellales bacterium]|jgi:DNA-binding CsgD family transcriptional regulator|nr:LuxR C-terminal-related transcriptional regulator [Gaiellales bacterium]
MSDTTAVSTALDRGRESYARRAWGDAYSELSAADGEAPLPPADLERLGIAAVLVGREAEGAALWERAHHELVEQGALVPSVRCAFWVAFSLLNRGEPAHAGGWLARAKRLLDDAGAAADGCAERGYLILMDGRRRVIEGDYPGALVLIGQAVEVGEQCGDNDLVALARHVQGRGLILRGEAAAGMALLDEVMVDVTTGEVSPHIVGIVYCGVIDACQEIFDLRRAKEWTAALSRWCESQPDLVAYTGTCLVHRAEIMQLHGAWPDAIDEVRRGCELFGDQPAAGAAFYRQAELYRLRGEFTKAEEAYRQASRLGREPHPGLAQLRLAQGQVGAAAAAIRRVAGEARDRTSRSHLLAAYIEIMMADGDVAAATAATDELADIAEALDAPLLRATAATARGAVLVAKGGDTLDALVALRGAWTRWQELDAPYEAARVRVLIGLACRGLGDEDTAQMEFDAARWVFERLGAEPDLARVDAVSGKRDAVSPGGLTDREIEVLRLVAAGKTNRAIAAELVLSEKTVARHVSNILTKLDLSSRAAATAYAYENDLL